MAFNDKTHLVDAFQCVASSHNMPAERAIELFRQLPMDIKAAPAFLDQFNRVWRYSYVPPFDKLAGDTVLFGTTQAPEVEHLFLALRAADKHLSDAQTLQFLDRLQEPVRHQDTLFEFAPVVRIPEGTSAEFEPEGIGEGNRKFDWLFTAEKYVPIALEVKYRVKDLIEHMKQILPGISNGQDNAGGGPADPSYLFPGTVEKFQRCSPDVRLQGAWIHPHIAVAKDELQTFFDSLDHERLHFALLVDWEGEAYPLARTAKIETQVLSFFNLTKSERYVLP